jgi:hypothetical protein
MHENLIFVSSKIQQKWWSAIPTIFYRDTTYIWILITSLLFLPLMLIREMKHLTGFSILGFLTIVYVTIIIVGYSFDTSLITMSENLPKLDYFKVS